LAEVKKLEVFSAKLDRDDEGDDDDAALAQRQHAREQAILASERGQAAPLVHYIPSSGAAGPSSAGAGTRGSGLGGAARHG